MKVTNLIPINFTEIIILIFSYTSIASAYIILYYVSVSISAYDLET